MKNQEEQMERNYLNYRSIALCILFICASCSSPSKKEETSELKSNSSASSDLKEFSGDSSVDIQYVLGRDHYRFLASVKGDLTTANTSLDKQVLDKGSVDRNKYSDFLKKAF